LTGLFLMISFSLAQGVVKDETIVESAEETMVEPVHISYVEGNVKLGLEDAEANMPISENDMITTTNGRVEISLGQENYLWLNANAQVEFIFVDENSVKIFLKSGNIYVRANGKSVEVQTSKQSFMLGSGIYRIEAQGKKLDALRIIDDFDRFVEAREKEFNRPSTQTSYLPEELNEYESTLSCYGDWRYYRPYGYVWIPQVAYGWNPYSYGRWAWYPILGWTWISYDGPWGWCVFHYGRWHFHATLGWYWIPAPGWRSAWVWWYLQDDYYSWSPMCWGGSNGYYYRNYGNYYYGRIDSRIWTTVHKDQLRSRNVSKSVIHRDELKRRLPESISMNQLKTSLSRSTVTTTISKSVTRLSGRDAIDANRIIRNPGQIKQQIRVQPQDSVRIQPQARKSTESFYPSRPSIRSSSPSYIRSRESTRSTPQFSRSPIYRTSPSLSRPSFSVSHSFYRPSFSQSPSHSLSSSSKIRKK